MFGEIKMYNISEKVEDRAKAIINGLYKVVHWLSIAAKMYDFEWPISDYLNAAKWRDAA